MACTVPVSYTHLDVYKRQAEDNMYGTVGANPYVEGGLGVAYLYACWNGELDVTSLPNEMCIRDRPEGVRVRRL